MVESDSDTKGMLRHLVYWKPVYCKNVRNTDFESGIPEVVSRMTRGALISQILRMPEKKAISFEEAVRLINQMSFEALQKHDPKLCVSLYKNFVRTISDAGYHIELTGDEFRPYLTEQLPC